MRKNRAPQNPNVFFGVLSSYPFSKCDCHRGPGGDDSSTTRSGGSFSTGGKKSWDTCPNEPFVVLIGVLCFQLMYHKKLLRSVNTCFWGFQNHVEVPGLVTNVHLEHHLMSLVNQELGPSPSEPIPWFGPPANDETKSGLASQHCCPEGAHRC